MAVIGLIDVLDDVETIDGKLIVFCLYFWILRFSFIFHDEISIESELITEFLFFISDTEMMRCVGPTGKYPEAMLINTIFIYNRIYEVRPTDNWLIK